MPGIKFLQRSKKIPWKHVSKERANKSGSGWEKMSRKDSGETMEWDISCVYSQPHKCSGVIYLSMVTNSEL